MANETLIAQVKAIIKATLETEEAALRKQMNELAEQRKYSEIVFDKEHNIAGESLRNGLNSRWLNVLRMLSVGDFSITWIERELRGDMTTLRKIHVALGDKV